MHGLPRSTFRFDISESLPRGTLNSDAANERSLNANLWKSYCEPSDWLNASLLLQTKKSKNKYPLSDWFNLHLCSFSGVVITLPRMPVYAVSKRSMVAALMIETVQVGEVTAFVPPGSLVHWGTVSTVRVVVLIFGGERHAIMIRQRIVSSSSYKNR